MPPRATTVDGPALLPGLRAPELAPRFPIPMRGNEMLALSAELDNQAPSSSARRDRVPGLRAGEQGRTVDVVDR